MGRIISILTVPLFVLIITGCSVKTLFKADPLDEKEIYKGREIVTKESDKAVVSAEFDGQSENDFVFYVEIENKSEEDLIIRPEEIYIDPLKEDLKTPESNLPLLWAINPEYEIDEINRQMKNRDNLHGFTTGLNAAVAVISIIGNLTDSDEKHDGKKVAHTISDWADNQIREEIDYGIAKDEMESQKQFWKNEALRYTELKSGNSVGGLVFIPFDKRIKRFRLMIPAGDGIYEFYYKVIKLN